MRALRHRPAGPGGPLVGDHPRGAGRRAHRRRRVSRSAPRSTTAGTSAAGWTSVLTCPSSEGPHGTRTGRIPTPKPCTSTATWAPNGSTSPRPIPCGWRTSSSTTACSSTPTCDAERPPAVTRTHDRDGAGRGAGHRRDSGRTFPHSNDAGYEYWARVLISTRKARARQDEGPLLNREQGLAGDVPESTVNSSPNSVPRACRPSAAVRAEEWRGGHPLSAMFNI